MQWPNEEPAEGAAERFGIQSEPLWTPRGVACSESKGLRHSGRGLNPHDDHCFAVIGRPDDDVALFTGLRVAERLDRDTAQ